MIIYEKENKLNINFDNSTEAEPDVVISKEDGQVNIEAGGQPIGGGGGALVVNMTKDGQWHYTADKTLKEIFDAAKTLVIIVHWPDEGISTNRYEPVGVKIYSGSHYICYGDMSGYIYANSEDDNETSWNIPD